LESSYRLDPIEFEPNFYWVFEDISKKDSKKSFKEIKVEISDIFGN
jgi:hypothetical protein